MWTEPQQTTNHGLHCYCTQAFSSTSFVQWHTRAFAYPISSYFYMRCARLYPAQAMYSHRFISRIGEPYIIRELVHIMRAAVLVVCVYMASNLLSHAMWIWTSWWKLCISRTVIWLWDNLQTSYRLQNTWLRSTLDLLLIIAQIIAMFMDIIRVFGCWVSTWRIYLRWQYVWKEGPFSI